MDFILSQRTCLVLCLGIGEQNDGGGQVVLDGKRKKALCLRNKEVLVLFVLWCHIKITHQRMFTIYLIFLKEQWFHFMAIANKVMCPRGRKLLSSPLPLLSHCSYYLFVCGISFSFLFNEISSSTHYPCKTTLTLQKFDANTNENNTKPKRHIQKFLFSGVSSHKKSPYFKIFQCSVLHYI